MAEPESSLPPRSVLQAEWDVVRARRQAAGLGARDSRTDADDLSTFDAESGFRMTDAELVGLSLSGGGIRSASFNLGVLQGLHHYGVLPYVDLLSTVSGGGYIGGCWSASATPDDPFPLARPARATEPPVLAHVRNRVRYLDHGGARDWLRGVTSVAAGLTTNLLGLLLLPVLVAFLVSIGWGGEIWRAAERGVLPWGVFVVTPAVVVGLVAAVAAQPLLWARAERSASRDGTGGSKRLKRRAFSRDLLATMAIGTVVTAGIEALPVLTVLAHGLLELDLGVRELWAAGGSAGSVLGGLFASRAASALDGAKQAIAMLLGAFAAVALPMVVAIYIADLMVFELGVHGPGLLHRIGEVPPWAWAAVAGLLLFGLLVDVNDTGPHPFYRDGLSRTFLVRARGKGGDLDHLDELPLSALNSEGSAAPLHFVNTAINVPASEDPTLRGRVADWFELSRTACGGPRTGWVPTADYERWAPRLDLDTAVAVSAAAASPNMGTYTMPALTPLLTLLNARLGVWLPHPRMVRPGSRPGPLARWRSRPGARWLLTEALGGMDGSEHLVHLSDGGHLENMGAVTLLRRRCKLVVVGDGEADPDAGFDGLGDLVRFARVDLGVEIELDLDAFRPDGDGLAQAHAAVGRIHYPETPTRPAETGVLLVLKLSVTGDEDVVAKSYRAANPAFPFESTGDQFFDEAQFEAYRSLGRHVVESLGDPGRALGEAPTWDDVLAWVEDLRVLLAGGGRGADLVVDDPLTRRFTEQTPRLRPDDPASVLSGVAARLGAIGAAVRDDGLAFAASSAAPSAEGSLSTWRRWAEDPGVRWAAAIVLPGADPELQIFCRQQLDLGWKVVWDEVKTWPAGLGDGEAPRAGVHRFAGRLAWDDHVSDLPVAWMTLEVAPIGGQVRVLASGLAAGFGGPHAHRRAATSAGPFLGRWQAARGEAQQGLVGTTSALLNFGTEDAVPAGGDDIDLAALPAPLEDEA